MEIEINNSSEIKVIRDNNKTDIFRLGDFIYIKTKKSKKGIVEVINRVITIPSYKIIGNIVEICSDYMVIDEREFNGLIGTVVFYDNIDIALNYDIESTDRLFDRKLK